MIERTTIRLPEELLSRARRKATAERRTLTSLIEEGLRLVLAKRSGVPRADRVLPPVSKAKGGLLPGVDLDAQSELGEAEDLAYVERMKRFR